jgi:hypothetical protein
VKGIAILFKENIQERVAATCKWKKKRYGHRN